MAGKNKPCIEVKDLRKSFGQQQVLKGVNVQVSSAETLAVLGRSGIGKSVLLKLLIGIEQPDSGSIQIDGVEIAGLGERQLNEVRKKIGFLFQHAALYDSLTVEENVAFPLLRHARLSETERKQKVRELLSGVGMEDTLVDDYRLKAGRILWRLKVALRLKTPEDFPADSRLKAWWAR